MLVQRTTYRQIIAGLKHYEKQFLEDRKENPGKIPAGYGIPLRVMIEGKIRANEHRCQKGLPDKVLEYLCEKGLLVHYHGDYTFPGVDLPSKSEMDDHLKELVNTLFPNSGG